MNQFLFIPVLSVGFIGRRSINLLLDLEVVTFYMNDHLVSCQWIQSHPHGVGSRGNKVPYKVFCKLFSGTKGRAFVETLSPVSEIQDFESRDCVGMFF